MDADMLKKDDPLRLACLIHNHPVERLCSGYWNEWSKNTLANISKNIRRIRSTYDQGNFHYMRAHISHIRHLNKRKYTRKRKTQFCIFVPTDVYDAMVLDKDNNNNKWQESIQKEMGGIMDRKTFVFLPPGSVPPEGYREAPLMMIYSVKPDL
jgi:hypothetical protein